MNGNVSPAALGNLQKGDACSVTLRGNRLVNNNCTFIFIVVLNWCIILNTILHSVFDDCVCVCGNNVFDYCVCVCGDNVFDDCVCVCGDNVFDYCVCVCDDCVRVCVW